jgi:hypothetical protein
VGNAARVVRQTKSGPATPSGTRDNLNPLEWEDAKSDSPSPGRDRLSVPDSEQSSLRHSGSSEFEESTTDRDVGRSERNKPPQKVAVSGGSSDDGDTMSEMFIVDGFSD